MDMIKQHHQKPGKTDSSGKEIFNPFNCTFTNKAFLPISQTTLDISKPMGRKLMACRKLMASKKKKKEEEEEESLTVEVYHKRYSIQEKI